MAREVAGGDAAAGKTYFDQNCASCHAADLQDIAKKYDAVSLQEQVLRPNRLSGPPSFKLDALHDTRMATARERHNSLLENYTPVQVANLIAYLQTR